MAGPSPAFLIPQRVTWPPGVLARCPSQGEGLVPRSFCPHTDLVGPVPGHGIGFVAGGSQQRRRLQEAEVAVRKSSLPFSLGVSTWGSPLWPVTLYIGNDGSLSWCDPVEFCPVLRSGCLFTVPALGTRSREQCVCWEPGQRGPLRTPLCSL